MSLAAHIWLIGIYWLDPFFSSRAHVDKPCTGNEPVQGLKKQLLERITNSVSHICQVVRDIGVNRIDHGVNAIEDNDLCDEIKRRSLSLTMCPISDAYVVDGTRSEIIAAMLQGGMRVTVNSDDPAYFPGYMNENLIQVQEEVDLRKAYFGLWQGISLAQVLITGVTRTYQIA